MGFEHFSKEAGNRGFGIFSHKWEDGEWTFWLQFRALDPDGRQPVEAPIPLTLVSEIRLNYCPWCGAKLQEFYEFSVEGLKRTDLKLTY